MPNDPELDDCKPVRHQCHLFAENFRRHILGAFDDEFIMDMSAAEAVRERFHGIHQEASGVGLYDIFHKFRAVVFVPLLLLIGSELE